MTTFLIDAGNLATVNGERYHAMVDNFLSPILEDYDIDYLCLCVSTRRQHHRTFGELYYHLDLIVMDHFLNSFLHYSFSINVKRRCSLLLQPLYTVTFSYRM